MKFMSSFHAVILLISLSLAGIIFFQYHWLYTTLINNQRIFADKMLVNIDGVCRSLMEEKNSQPAAAATPDPDASTLLVVRALSNVFAMREFSGLRFEYALNTDSGHVFSPGYRVFVQDSVRDKIQFNIFLSSHNNPYKGQALTVLVPGIKSRLLREMSWMIAGAALSTCIIVVIFCITLNAIVRQRKLNRLRQYFISHMAQAFATPLSAISLAADALGNEKVRQDKTRLDYFSTVIKDESRRLQKHMEAILHTPLKLYRAAHGRIGRKT